MKQIAVMAHLVAGYPNEAGWMLAAQALFDAGVRILEIQIPFSDPTSDGPVITRASEDALRAGFRVQDIFRYIRHAQHVGFREIYIMTYANIVHCWEVEDFLEEMKAQQISGVIVPDYPLEDDDKFYQRAAEIGIDALPVAVSTMPRDRLALLRSRNSCKVYAALRQGVTGCSADITDACREFLGSLDIPYVFAGFGISSRSHVESLRGYAYAAVIGSHITRAISKGDAVYDQVKTAIVSCMPEARHAH